eukprot:CAMPEP_0117687286 /NCGR_PEP_ID=MMETSP0804-20121206/23042_1 /TAXON_ID=1074897 /ORGANISM="Tetraselmis astigmatica, Strain CCMP880" /LENGTH=1720 /DNA_ID=CAMNT_0005499315 /DNA_START=24 /DNA_END=5186 /DNA_ORIENTATION=-
MQAEEGRQGSLDQASAYRLPLGPVPKRKRNKRRRSDMSRPSTPASAFPCGGQSSLSAFNSTQQAAKLPASSLPHRTGDGRRSLEASGNRHASSSRAARERGASRTSAKETLSDEDFEKGLLVSGSEEEIPPELVRYGDIEKFLAWRSACPSGSQRNFNRKGKEYYVKWKGRSYLHCSWVEQSQLDAAAHHFPGLKQRIRMFDHKRLPESIALSRESDLDEEAEEEDGEQAQGKAAADALARSHKPLVHGVEPSWTTVERVIDMRHREDAIQYMVKWEGLGYDEATWEWAKDIRGAEAEGAVSKFAGLCSIAKSAEQRQRCCQASLPQAGLERGSVRQYSQTPSFLAGGTLHPYQLEGLNWLVFAWRQHKHVILADEMGLGKTVQAVSYITSLREDMFVKRPQLVVVPLSTLPNWERELKTWAPQLNVVSFIGNAASRAIIKKFELYAERPADDRGGRSRASLAARVRFDVLLTTYEMMLAEEATLKTMEWETMIVDEGHRLKNKASRLFQVLHGFNTRQRTLLTGTPLQNNLDELFMLMHFLEPGKFSSLEDFQAQFSEVAAEEQMARLHTLLKPHLLRRLKKDVLKQMPPKKEQMVRVELSDQQKEYYKSVLTKSYPVLVSSRQAGGQIPAKLKNVVMELRKCCNHPYLFEGAESAALRSNSKEEIHQQLTAASGKLALLARMMPRLKAAGHRVLIYSQFSRMLDILEDWLAGAGWGGYCRIDGSVSSAARQLRIDRFNKERDSYFCFLLSTRAGGLGINLATADTVIIFDSDWNPHNDLQAQARAHRLGQQKAVMIYRLVTRATIEERMMQQSKKKLMLEHVVVHKMSKDTAEYKQNELSDILRYGAQELFGITDQPKQRPDSAAEAAGGPKGVAEAAAAVQHGGAKSPEDTGRPKSAVAQEEEAGRTGGQVGKGIVYTDEDVERLLDRTELLEAHKRIEAGQGTGEEEEEEEYLKAFKVADFRVMAKTSAAAEEEGKDGNPLLGEDMDPEDNKSYWDRLIQDEYSHRLAEELNSMGKGRRTRREINYNEAIKTSRQHSDPGSLENEDVKRAAPAAAGPKRQRRSAAERAASGGGHRGPNKMGSSRLEATAGEGPEAVPLLEGHGDNLKVLGFSLGERIRFLNMLMRFGLTSHGAGGVGFDWGPFVQRHPHKDPALVARYGELLLGRLAGRPREIGPHNGGGIPAKAILLHHSPSAILKRLGLLHALHCKAVLVAGTPAVCFQAGTETVRMPCRAHWSAANDSLLLQGLVKHGYGRWRDILQDEQLSLQSPVEVEMRSQAAPACEPAGPCSQPASRSSGGRGSEAASVVAANSDSSNHVGAVAGGRGGSASGCELRNGEGQESRDSEDDAMEVEQVARQVGQEIEEDRGEEEKGEGPILIPRGSLRLKRAQRFGSRPEAEKEESGTEDERPAKSEIEWIRERASKLGDCALAELFPDPVDQPPPKPDPATQVSRGYAWVAMHMPPHFPYGGELRRQGPPGSATGGLAVSCSSGTGDGRNSMVGSGLRGLSLSTSVMKGDHQRRGAIQAVVATYNVLCRTAGQVRSDAATAAKCSSEEDAVAEAGRMFCSNLKRMESLCSSLLEALRKEHERSEGLRKADAARLEQAHREAAVIKARAQQEQLQALLLQQQQHWGWVPSSGHMLHSTTGAGLVMPPPSLSYSAPGLVRMGDSKAGLHLPHHFLQHPIPPGGLGHHHPSHVDRAMMSGGAPEVMMLSDSD